jgi:hypothetical protein
VPFSNFSSDDVYEEDQEDDTEKIGDGVYTSARLSVCP